MKLHTSVTNKRVLNLFATLESRFMKKHNNFYTYSKSIYINSQTKMIITCPTHGDFEQIPSSHMVGMGCMRCAIENNHNKSRKTTKQFMLDAKRVHGDKYNYSKVNYIGNKKPVLIICDKHGKFYQPPSAHLVGKGCNKCGEDVTADKKRLSEKEFISRINVKDITIRGKYKNADNKILVECNVCNHKWSIYSQYLIGKNSSGCPKCSKKYRQTPSEYRQEMKLLHPTLTIIGDYVKAHDGVDTLCNKCNHMWKITPTALKTGKGCPFCRETKQGFKSKDPAELYLYDIEDTYLGFGITGNIVERSKQHAYTFKQADKNALLITSFSFDDGKKAHCVEQEIRKQFITMDTGLVGFRTEATSINNLDAVLLLIEREMAKIAS